MFSISRRTLPFPVFCDLVNGGAPFACMAIHLRAERCDLAAEGRVPERREQVRRTGAREALSRLRSRLAGDDEQEGGEEEAGVGDGGAVPLHAVDDQLVCALCLGEALGHGLTPYAFLQSRYRSRYASKSVSTWQKR